MRTVFQYKVRHTITRFLILAAVVILLAGCAGLIQPPSDQPRARALVNISVNANQDLTMFKGLGRVDLVTPEVNMSGRLALAGELPNKMRIELLSPLGQSLMRLAANGKTIVIGSNQTSEIHQLQQSHSVLERIIHIPIDIETLLTLLAGRLPTREYAAAQVLQESNTHMRVALKNRWSAILATVEFDLLDRQVTQYTALESDGSVRYRIKWLQWQNVLGYRLPHELEVTADDHHQMKLVMDRYWCNVQIPEDIFSAVAAGQK